MDCDCGLILERLERIERILLEIMEGQSKIKARKKRKPSAYNEFIGRCMKEGKDMKACAAEYKRSKQ